MYFIDSIVEQRVYFVLRLQRGSQASIKGRLFEGFIGLGEGDIALCSMGELLKIVGRESHIG